MRAQILNIILLLTVSLIFSSCEEKLSEGFLKRENPNDMTDENFWESEKDFNSGMGSIYSIMDINAVFNGRGWELMNGRSDEIRSTYTSNENMYAWFLANESNDYIWMRYSFFYKGIFRANHLLEMLEKKGDFLNEETKNQLKAEARCLRGIYHFYLLQDFGYICYVDKAYQTLAEMQTKLLQQHQDTVFAKIISDLEFSSQYLPEKWDDNNIGRATKGTAMAFTGLTYLNWMQFQKAASVLGELIGNNPSGPSSIGDYQLVPNYADLWTLSGENNIESVFEVQFGLAGGPNLWTWDSNEASLGNFIGKNSTYQEEGWLSMQIYMCQNEALDSVWQYQEFFKDPYKTYIPTSTNKVSDVFDPRLTGGLIFQWSAAGEVGTGYGGKEFIDGGASGVSGAVSYWNHAFGLGKAASLWAEHQIEISPLNWPLMRYAEVLLLKAEAENEMGNVQEAIKYIDPVRVRADLPKILDQPDASAWTQEDVRTEIIHQRYIELFGEGKRWYDMMRYQRNPNFTFNVKDTLDVHDFPHKKWNAGLHAENFDIGKDEYLPIPLKALDANPKLTDNYTHSVFESSNFK